MSDPTNLFPCPTVDTATVEATGEERREAARIRDVSVVIPGDRPITAYIVEPLEAPTGQAARPGLLFAHWFDTEAPNGDRTEFLDEAELLAARGVTSLLPQLTFPWTADPTGSRHDRARVVAEVGRLRVCINVLRSLPGVDGARIGVIGHDFGAMHAVLAAAAEGDVRALVFVAGTPRWADWFLPFWPIDEDRLDYQRVMRDVDPIEHLPDLEDTKVLLQFARSDFFIAAMTGLELRRAAGEAAELKAYDSEHDMATDDVRADRLRFLEEALRYPR